MSDGDSILGSVADAGKDIFKEALSQVVGSGPAVAKTASQQVAGFTSKDDEEKKKADQIATFQRIKAIEAEMAKIGSQQQNPGPEIQKSEVPTENSLDKLGPTKNQVDEATRQAVGKAEQGRNFKG